MEARHLAQTLKAGNRGLQTIISFPHEIPEDAIRTINSWRVV